MKRFIICLLALMMTLLALSAALSEELDPVRLAIESFACGEKDAASLDSLLASLPDTLEPGEMVSHTWEGADGATYTLVYYAETAVSVLPDAPAPQPADDALTGEEILQMVDDRQIAFRPAVEISYLSEEQQYTLLEAMQYNDATPSLAQAIKMKKFMQDGKLTDEVIQSIMEEEKPNQKEKPAFRDERITKLIPKNVPRGQETDFVVKALEFYNRHLQRSKAHER